MAEIETPDVNVDAILDPQDVSVSVEDVIVIKGQDADIAAAEAATSAANEAAINANQAAANANQIATEIQAAVDSANQAGANANAAAESANEKASLAASKAVEAESAATAANAAKQAADTASATANAAAATATAAAGNAQGVADTVQAKLDAGEFKGEKGDKGDPGEVTLEQLNAVDKQVQKNDARLDIVESVLSEGYFGWQLESETSYDHAVPSNAVTVKDEAYSFAQMVGLEGQSVVWNQLLSVDGRTGSVVDTGVRRDYVGRFIKFNGTVTQGGTSIWYLNSATYPMNFIAGHVYYMTHNVVSGSKTDGYARLRFMKAANTYAPIFTCTETTSVNGTLRFELQGGTTFTDYMIEVFFFDLTRMFGAGNEPTSVDDHRIEWVKRYTAEHPEYNTGQVVSANVTEIQSWGKNLLDAFGEYVKADTTYSGVTIVNEGDKYRLSGTNTGTGFGFNSWYPTKKLYLPAGTYTLSNSSEDGWRLETRINGSSTMPRGTFTINEGDYIDGWRVYVYANATVDAVFYPQLERGDTATPYSPYGMKDSIDLPELDLKSAGTARDRADFLADEVTRKVGVVDMGTLAWNTNEKYGFVTSDPAIRRAVAHPASGSYMSNMLCGSFVTESWSKVWSAGVKSGLIGLYHDEYGNQIGVSPLVDYASPADFKAAMQGVMLYYELAEPTTEPFTVPKSFMQAEPNGYVRFAQPDDTMAVPNAISFPVDRRAVLNG